MCEEQLSSSSYTDTRLLEHVKTPVRTEGSLLELVFDKCYFCIKFYCFVFFFSNDFISVFFSFIEAGLYHCSVLCLTNWNLTFTLFFSNVVVSVS